LWSACWFSNGDASYYNQHRWRSIYPSYELADDIFLADSPLYNADITIPAYLNMLKSLNVDQNTFLIDGSGNDVYMGYVYAKKDTLFKHLSWGDKFIWSKFEGIDINPKINYILKTVQMFPIERLFSGSRLTYNSANTILGTKVNIKNFIQKLSNKYNSLQSNDAKNFYKGRVFDTVSINPKAKMISDYMNIEYSLPFCDENIIDYYFNMKNEDKFSIKEGKNKVGLRKLIHKELGDFEYVKNKGSFRFNIEDFISSNLDKIKNDIYKMNDKLPGLKKVADDLISKCKNYVFAYELYTLWVTIEWLNNREDEQLKYLTTECKSDYKLEINL